MTNGKPNTWPSMASREAYQARTRVFQKKLSSIIGPPAEESMANRVKHMNQYAGSSFDDFLAEEGILEEATARARNRVGARPRLRPLDFQKPRFALTPTAL